MMGDRYSVELRVKLRKSTKAGMTDDNAYAEYDAFAVDAWAYGEEDWVWNSSRLLFRLRTRARDVGRAFTRRLRKEGWSWKRGSMRLETGEGGDLLQLCDAKTGEPVFALLWREEQSGQGGCDDDQ